MRPCQDEFGRSIVGEVFDGNKPFSSRLAYRYMMMEMIGTMYLTILCLGSLVSTRLLLNSESNTHASSEIVVQALAAGLVRREMRLEKGEGEEYKRVKILIFFVIVSCPIRSRDRQRSCTIRTLT